MPISRHLSTQARPLQPPTAPGGEPGATSEILSVSALNRAARQSLEAGFPLVWVEGELSNVARPRSGHVYFTLKDDQAQVRCALFRQRAQWVAVDLDGGQLVRVLARVSLYEPRGDFQLLVEVVEAAGDGALARAFEALKQRLDGEGLFAREAKAALPTTVRRVGVITSATGAAIRDVLAVINRRFPVIDVVVYPALVQGLQAPASLRTALAAAIRRNEVDVLVLVRGGGSQEDLWAYNDERLARALRTCPIPVVTGIGHEVDLTIADLVADIYASTPTAAAEAVTPDGEAWRRWLTTQPQRARRALQTRIAREQQNLTGLARRVLGQHPQRRLLRRAQRLDDLEGRLVRAGTAKASTARAHLGQQQARLLRAAPHRRTHQERERLRALHRRLATALERVLERCEARVGALARGLHGASPLNTLERGYAMVTRSDNQSLVTDAAEIEPETLLDVRVRRGRLHVQVLGRSDVDDTDRP